MALQSPQRSSIEYRLSELIQIETVSAELHVRGQKPFEDFMSRLQTLYPLVYSILKREQIADFGYLFHWQGTSAKKPLVLMAHYDVVPVDITDPWTHPPFAGVIADGFVYGRGALDDKGPLVVILDAVEELLTTDYVPSQDVYLSFCGNEETTGAAAQEVAHQLHLRNITPWLVLDEGGAVTDSPLPFVTGTAAMVGIGEKGLASVELSTRSAGGHASIPPPLTAIGRIARALTRLTPNTFGVKTPHAISRMLKLFAARSTPVGRLFYTMLSALPWISARVFSVLGGEAAAMVRTTLAPTLTAGGTASNVLPSQASATLNLRLALGQTVAGTVAQLRKRINDEQVSITVLSGSDASPEAPVDGAEFALISTAVRASHPAAVTVPYVTMQATDSRHFQQYWQATYRFAPLHMNAADRATIHGVDERVRITELAAGVLFHRALIEGLPR